MTIAIIPAIDLMEGQCVRLTQGRRESRVVYSKDPLSIAQKWEQAGATRLHIVDLDGAFTGAPKNLETIRAIRNAVSMKIEVGGGIRTSDTINSYLQIGIDFIILGTKALQDTAWLKTQAELHRARIIVGVDAKGGLVATHGWTVTESVTASQFASKLQDIGIDTIIYTDVAKDGMLTGPNIDSLSRLAEDVNLNIIASGGIHTIKDIQSIKQLKKQNIIGIITGKALYEKSLDLKEAIELVEEA